MDAFLSYAREDKRYYPLLVRMLQFHHIDVWYDAQLPVGVNYKEELDRAITDARCMLVLATVKSLESRWIAREVTTYRSVHPDRPIVPLLFEEVVVDRVFEGLSDFQGIPFYSDLDHGFSALVGAFGKSYLPVIDRRQRDDRRKTDRRQHERREASTETRLRIGMWKNFSAQTGHTEYGTFGHALKMAQPDSSGFRARFASPRSPTRDELDAGRIAAINRAAMVFIDEGSELARYRFLSHESGSEVELTFHDLRNLIHETCREMETFGELVNVYVIERLAEKLARRYLVQPRDRRMSDRRTGADRRSME